MRKLSVPGLSVWAGPAAQLGAEDPGMEGGYRRQPPGNRRKVLKRLRPRGIPTRLLSENSRWEYEGGFQMAAPVEIERITIETQKSRTRAIAMEPKAREKFLTLGR